MKHSSGYPRVDEKKFIELFQLIYEKKLKYHYFGTPNKLMDLGICEADPTKGDKQTPRASCGSSRHYLGSSLPKRIEPGSDRPPGSICQWSENLFANGGNKKMPKDTVEMQSVKTDRETLSRKDESVSSTNKLQRKEE